MKVYPRLGLLLAFAVGCAETGIAPSDHALKGLGHAVNHIEEGNQDAPEGVPYEYQFPTILYAVAGDIGFVDGTAYVQSIVRYFGTSALARATVTTDSGSATSESETSDAWPANRDHMVTTRYFMGACRGTIRGQAYGRIWNELLWGSVLKWGTKSDDVPLTFQCPTTSGGGGSGGVEDTDMMTCYTLEIDHYYYYPDTGRVEYRYTEFYTWCEYSEYMT